MNNAAAKRRNVIDMAYGFSAMQRVFEKSSSKKILRLLDESFTKLAKVNTENEYRTVHDSFCSQFRGDVKTSKGSKHPSYGQAAKVFDVAVKVYVHYCGYPTAEKAEKLSKMLHGAIDNPILNHLKSKYPERHISAKSLGDINDHMYWVLQQLIKLESQGENMSPVEWDDVIWSELNRAS